MEDKELKSHQIMHHSRNQTLDSGRKRKRNTLNMAVLKKIKNFDKYKINGLKKLSTRTCLFHDFFHF